MAKERKKDFSQEFSKVTHLDSRRKPKKKVLTQKRILISILCLLAVTCVLFSPIFCATNIEVSKMDQYTAAEICDKIGLNKNSNLFLFGKTSAAKTLKKDPYIASAKVSMKLPNTMKVTIQERKVRGYIPYMGSYLYIDEYGRVLDVQTSFKKALPVVNGLAFDHFKEGELLEVENQESFDIVVKIAQMMTKYELLDVVMELDVSDPEKIVAYINKVTIHLGDITDCDQKMRTLAQIIKTIPDKDRGVLDLSDLKKPIVFQYLT